MKPRNKISFSLVSEELEQLTEKQGAVHLHPLLHYKAFSYQAEEGVIGYITIKAKTADSKTTKELFIYYDSELCRQNYTKLPREKNFCRSVSGGLEHEATIRIPSFINVMHYFAVELLYPNNTEESHITLEYELIPAEVLDINTTKLVKFDQAYVTPFILKNNGYEEIVIKVMNTSPEGVCRIYVDYEGCGEILNKLPDQEKNCFDSRVPKDGHICMLRFNTKEKKDTIYFGVRTSKTTAHMKLIVNGISK
jgi:hypothetical protein